MARNAYQQQLLAAAAIGAGGRVLTLGTIGWAALNFVNGILVTSATAGNRQLVMRVTDPNTNRLIQIPSPSLIAASLTTNIVFASGVAPVTLTAGSIVVPIPFDMPLPAAAVITVLDTAAIDSAGDTLSLLAGYTI